jgi:hypothetical protein
MPANPSKDYAIFWNDGTWKTYTLKQTDIKSLENAIIEGKRAVKLSVGVMVLSDIREVIEQRPVPIQTDERPAIPADLTAEEKAYVNELLREFYVPHAETDWGDMN